MRRFTLTVALFVVTYATCADQWLSATPETYSSYFGSYRLTVYPRQVSDPLAFFEDKLAAVEPAGQEATEQARCEATLEQLVGSHYEQLWRKPLVNDVAPVSALVSDRSGAFVTFDNWHSKGCCDDTIVIYDRLGNMVRKFALTDILTEKEISNLPRTVSSTHWSGEHDLNWVEDVEVVSLSIVSNGKFGDPPDVEYKTLQIRLSDGQVIKPDHAPPN
jgi:hypothetical protein